MFYNPFVGNSRMQFMQPQNQFNQQQNQYDFSGWGDRLTKIEEGIASLTNQFNNFQTPGDVAPEYQGNIAPESLEQTTNAPDLLGGIEALEPPQNTGFNFDPSGGSLMNQLSSVYNVPPLGNMPQTDTGGSPPQLQGADLGAVRSPTLNNLQPPGFPTPQLKTETGGESIFLTPENAAQYGFTPPNPNMAGAQVMKYWDKQGNASYQKTPETAYEGTGYKYHGLTESPMSQESVGLIGLAAYQSQNKGMV